MYVYIHINMHILYNIYAHFALNTCTICIPFHFVSNTQYITVYFVSNTLYMYILYLIHYIAVLRTYTYTLYILHTVCVYYTVYHCTSRIFCIPTHITL